MQQSETRPCDPSLWCHSRHGEEATALLRWAILAIVVIALLPTGWSRAAAGDGAKEGESCTPHVPREYLPLMARGAMKEVAELSDRRLREAVGSDMPDMTMRAAGGVERRFSDLAGSASAYFILPLHLEPKKFERWISELEERGWKTRSGRDAVIVLYAAVNVRAVKRALRKRNVVVAERPFPGFLSHVVLYPTILLVSPELRFEGFTINPDGA